MIGWPDRLLSATRNSLHSLLAGEEVILILSTRSDAHVPLVLKHLNALSSPYIWIDPTEYPRHTEASVEFDGTKLNIGLATEQETYDLSLVTAVWSRRPGSPTPIADTPSYAHSFIQRTSRHFLDGLYEILDSLWVPAPPPVDRRAHNKLRQLKLAQDLGFQIPKTLVTNSPRKARYFRNSLDGEVISKSLISEEIDIMDVTHRIFHTRPVTQRDALYLESVRHGPVIFQEDVQKVVEVRSTVIGNQIFSAEIHSQSHPKTVHDWRHYDVAIPYRRHTLPNTVESKLLQFTSALGLTFGAFDLILQPSGEYTFLELNPNGQWGFVEARTQLPLALTLAQFLSSGS